MSSHVHGQSADYQSDLQVLRSLNATFIHNYVTNDTVSHSKIIHPDFVYVSSKGKYTSRQKYLEDWAHGFDGTVYWDYRDERIDIFGNTALVRSANKYIVLHNGQEITGMAMYTDVYVKEHGRWLCVQAQVGQVTPENYPSDDTIVKVYDFRR